MIKQAASNALDALGLTFSAAAQTPTTKRTELTRGDLTGTNMEIIVSVVEYPPGAVSELHTHPGEEAFYVLEGATLETPDVKPTHTDNSRFEDPRLRRAPRRVR